MDKTQDWLTDKFILSVYFQVQGVNKGCTENDEFAMSLPEDYDQLMTKMFENLSKSLEKVRYDRKVKQEKDNEKSLSLRKAGNEAFVVAKNDPEALGKALELYTKSIAFAVPKSKELSFSYSNRSNVLLKLKKWSECLVDIERAFEFNCPEMLKPKLLARMGKCYAKLAEDSYIDAKFWLDKMPENKQIVYKEKLQNYPSTKESDHIMNEENEIPELKNLNNKYPSASDAVDIQYSDEFGRHLVATRDINVGEVLVVDKAYSQFLEPEKIYTHCAYCMGFLMAGIPCDECVNAVYCSRDCRDKAWAEYHQMECPLFDIEMQYYFCSVGVDCPETRQYIPCTPGITLRLLIRMYREAGGLQQLKERVEGILGSNFDTPQWINKDFYQQPGSLERILSLKSYEKEAKPLMWALVSVSSLRILFLLMKSTDFFNNRYDERTTFDVEILTHMMNNPDVLFIGKLLQKLMNLLRNGTMAGEYKNADLLEECPASIRGMMLLPFSSLINHSCASNCFMQFKINHAVLYSNIPIKKGEQIYVCYHKDYACSEKIERQTFLEKNYFFKCSCTACRHDWPTVDEPNLMTFPEQFDAMRRNPRVWPVMGPIMQILDKTARRNCFEGKEQMVEQLCKAIEVMCEGSDIRSPEVRLTRCVLNTIYLNTGIVFPLNPLIATK